MISKTFKGDLSEIGFPDILEFLRTSHKTGVLLLRQDQIKKSLHINNGNVIFASSNLPQERLGDLLLLWGLITKEHYEESVAMLTSKKRQGRILVEMGAITPKQLWEGVQNQIRQIVYSIFNWNHGLFYFAEGDLPGQEIITADVSILDLIVEGIRRIKDVTGLQRRFASRDVVLAPVDAPRELTRLEPFEAHVLNLVNDKRTLQEICRQSEIGDAETLKVLYMLLSIGYIKLKGGKMKERASEQKEMSPEEATGIIGNYNRMFSYLYRYMLREVGPITEHVMNKYLMELKEGNESILKNVSLKKDGTLDVATIQGNLGLTGGNNNKDLLIHSLNEFLYSTILAVKRTLGPEHETRVVETLKDFRPEL